MRGYTDPEQERDRVERRPYVPDEVRHGRVPGWVRRRRPGTGQRRPTGVVRGTRRRGAHVVHERRVQRARRTTSHGLRERVAAAQGHAQRPGQLLAPDQPKRAERPTDYSGRRRSAARTQAAHRQGQPPAHQPAGLREHAARRMRRVHPQIRQRRLGPQRPGPVPVFLRYRHTRAGRSPVRPAAHLQRVPGGVRSARRHVGHIMSDAVTVPENGRGGRRRQNAVQTKTYENAPIPVER